MLSLGHLLWFTRPLNIEILTSWSTRGTFFSLETDQQEHADRSDLRARFVLSILDWTCGTFGAAKSLLSHSTSISIIVPMLIMFLSGFHFEALDAVPSGHS